MRRDRYSQAGLKTRSSLYEHPCSTPDRGGHGNTAMAMLTSSRWLFTAVLATGLGITAMAPAPARASDDLVRVLVDVADVIYHGG